MFVFVNPESKDSRSNAFPLGLAYVAAAAEAYQSVAICDLNYEENRESIYKILREESVDFIGITACTPEIFSILELAALLKALSPNTIIGLGGPHATFQYMDVLLNYRQIDCAFIGEGEEATAALAKNIRDGAGDCWKGVNNIAYRAPNGKIVVQLGKKPQNFHTVDWPARHLLPPPSESSVKIYKNGKTVASISASRGCPGNCTFCALAVDKKHRWKCRSLEDLKNELLFLAHEYGVNALFFTDGDFLASPIRAKKIIAILESLPSPMEFTIAARTDSVVRAEAILDDLSRAGCTHIELGIESAAQTQLERYNKRVDLSTHRQAIQLLRNCKERGFVINVTLDFILFDPYVTLEELQCSYEFLMESGWANVENEFNLFNSIQLFPGTVYRERTIGQGLACSSLNSPYWHFVHPECGIIYAYLLQYQFTLLPRVKKMRAIISSLMEMNSNRQESVKSRLHILKLLKNLGGISYQYFGHLLEENGNVEQSRKIYASFEERITSLEDETSGLYGLMSGKADAKAAEYQ